MSPEAPMNPLGMKVSKEKFFWILALIFYGMMLFIGVVLFSDLRKFRPLRARMFHALNEDRIKGRFDSKDLSIELLRVEGPRDFLVRSKGSVVFKRSFEHDLLGPGDVLYTQEGTRVILAVPGTDEQIAIEENSVVVLDDFESVGEIQLSFLSGAWKLLDSNESSAGGRSLASATKKLKPAHVDTVKPTMAPLAKNTPQVPSRPSLPGTVPVIAPQPVASIDPPAKFFFQDEAALFEGAEQNRPVASLQALIKEIEKIEEKKTEATVPEIKSLAKSQLKVPLLAAKKIPKKHRENHIVLEDLFMRETIYIRNVMRRKMGRSPASDITLSIALYEASTGREGYRFNKAMALALDAYLRKYLIEGNCHLASELYANASSALTKIRSDAPGLTKWKRRWKKELVRELATERCN